MDNNNQNQTASGAYTPKDQIPTQNPPKVVDIASINAVNAAPSGGNFFKKKPIVNKFGPSYERGAKLRIIKL